MFYALQLTWQLFLLGAGLLFFVFISWSWPKVAAWLVIFLAPLYLLKISAWPITVLEALVWVFVAVWLIKKIIKCKDFRQFFKLIDRHLLLSVALILAGVALASIFSADLRVSLGVLKAYFVVPIIFSFVLAAIFEEGGAGRTVLAALTASSVAVAVISLVYLIFGQLTFDGRLAAFYLSPNHLAMWLAPGVLAALIFWFSAKKTYQKILLLMAYCLLLVVLYFTFSYGAWLGLGAALVFIIIYFWRLKIITGKQLLAIGSLCLFLGLIFISCQLNSEKLNNLFSSPRSSWQSRLMVWQAAGEILKDNWLIGIGPGLFQEHYLAYQKYFSIPYLEWAVPQPHNIFLAWWLQAGLIGLTGFIFLVWKFFQKSVNLLAAKKPFWPYNEEGQKGLILLVLVLMAMVVLLLAHGLIDTPFWKNDLALIFWVVIFLGYRASHRVY